MPQASNIIICQARIRTVHYHVRERNISLKLVFHWRLPAERLFSFVGITYVSSIHVNKTHAEKGKKSLRPKLVENQLFSHDDGLVGKYIRILKQVGQNVENNSCNEIHIIVKRK